VRVGGRGRGKEGGEGGCGGRRESDVQEVSMMEKGGTREFKCKKVQII